MLAHGPHPVPFIFLISVFLALVDLTFKKDENDKIEEDELYDIYIGR